MPQPIIQPYIIDPAYAAKLLEEPAYRDSSMAKVGQRQSVQQAGLHGEPGSKGLTLLREEPLAVGTMVLCDVTTVVLPLPLRVVGQVVESDSHDGRVVDRTVKVYKCILKVLAVNKDDLTRNENQLIERKIKQRGS